MATFQLSPQAQLDYDGIFEFGVLHFGLAQADKHLDEITVFMQTVSEFPLAYPVVEYQDSGIRRATIKGLSIFYCQIKNGIWVVRILGRQDPTRAI